MATEKEKKIIEMELQNRQFERASKETMSTLDKLKSKMNFNKTADSMGEITRAARRVDLSPIVKATEMAGRSFDAMGVVAFTVLQRITNAAITAGQRMASALTVNPVMDGFREYETKMNSVQTILANTQARQGKASASVIAEINAQADAAIKALDDVGSAGGGGSRRKSSASNQQNQIEALKKQKEELEARLGSELNNAEKLHTDKMKLFDEEHKLKLKNIEEERKKEMQQLDDKLSSLRATKKQQEDSYAKKTAQRAIDEANKLNKLELAVAEAKTPEEKAAATKRLEEYKLRKKQAIELAKLDDKSQLTVLESNYNNAKSPEEKAEALARLTEYREKKAHQASQKSMADQIKMVEKQKTEAQKKYDERVSLEKKAHNQQVSNANAAYENETKKMKTLYDDQRKLMQETHDQRMRQIEEQYKREQQYSGGGGGGGGRGGSKSAQLAAIEAERIRKTAEANAAAGMTEASTLEDVNNALKELNEYSDKTIYNFANMTENIGRFTAAGVNLDDSVKGIKGLSNVAAISGSNPQQAATAMYQLSQALAAGKIQLMDWKSIENASMGGAIFQDEIIKTARIFGVNIDEILAKHGAFRETLSEGWLTSDIMIAALTRFTGDLTEEMLIAEGHTAEEAKRIYELGQTALSAAADIKTFSQLVGVIQETLGSGWAYTWEILIGNFEEAKTLFTTIGTTLQGMINQAHDSRNAVAQGWVDMKGRELLINTLVKAFNNIVNIGSAIKKAWNNIFPAFTAEDLYSMTEGFDKLVDKLTLSEESLLAISTGFEFVFSIFKTIVDTIKEIVKGISGKLDLNLDVNNIVSMFSKLTEHVKGLKLSEGIITTFGTAVDKLKGIFSRLFETVSNFDFGSMVSKIGDGISELPGKLVGFAENNPLMVALFGGGALSAGIAKLVSAISGAFKGEVGIVSSITQTIEEVQGVLQAFQSAIKANALLNIAKAVALLAGSLFLLALLDGVSLSKGIAAIGTLIASLTAAMIAMGKMTSTFNNMTKVGDAMTGSAGKQTSFISISVALLSMAAAVAILAVASAILSVIPLEDTIANVITLMGLLVGSAVLLEKYAKGILPAAAGLLAISAAFALLTIPLIALGLIKFEKVLNGLMALGILMGELMLFVKVLDGKDLVNTSLGLMAIAVTLTALSAVLIILGIFVIPAALGLLVLIPLLLSLAGAVKIMSKSAAGAGAILAVGVAISLMSAALIALMVAIQLTDPHVIVAALLSMVAMIAMLVMASEQLENSVAGAWALIGLSAALLIMAAAIGVISTIDMEKLAPSILALTAVILVMALATELLDNGLKAAGTLSILALALVLIAGVFFVISKIDLSNIWVFIGAFTALMAVILLAGAISGIPMVALGLGALAGSLALIGLGAALFGIGVGIIVHSLLSLASFGKEGVDNIVSTFTYLSTKIPELINVLVDGFINGLNTIADRAPEIVIAVLNLMAQIVLGIIEGIKYVLAVSGQIVMAILTPIVEAMGTFFTVAGEIIWSLIKGIGAGIMYIIQAAFDVVVAFFSGLLNAIVTIAPQVIGWFIQLGIDLIQGLINGIVSIATSCVEAVVNLGTQLLEGLKKVLGINSPSKITSQYGEWFSEGLLNGINEKSGDVAGASEKLGLTAMSGLEDGLLGSTAGLEPTISPILSMDQPQLQLDLFNTSLQDSYKATAKMEGNINSHRQVDITVSGEVNVTGAGNQQTFQQTYKGIDLEKKLLNEVRQDIRWEAK